MEFTASLQRREEKAFSELRDRSLDRSLCSGCESGEWGTATYSAHGWADRVIQEAEDKGIEKVSFPSKVLHRIEVAHGGDDPFDLDARAWHPSVHFRAKHKR